MNVNVPCDGCKDGECTIDFKRFHEIDNMMEDAASADTAPTDEDPVDMMDKYDFY